MSPLPTAPLSPRFSAPAAGFLPPQHPEEHGVHVPPRQELPDQQGDAQPLPVLPPAEVLRGRHVQGRCVVGGGGAAAVRPSGPPPCPAAPSALGCSRHPAVCALGSSLVCGCPWAPWGCPRCPDVPALPGDGDGAAPRGAFLEGGPSGVIPCVSPRGGGPVAALCYMWISCRCRILSQRPGGEEAPPGEGVGVGGTPGAPPALSGAWGTAAAPAWGVLWGGRLRGPAGCRCPTAYPQCPPPPHSRAQ